MKQTITATAFLGALSIGVALAEEGFTQEEFLGAVERVVEAIDEEDYDKFESYFTGNTRGMQPDELWRGALGLLQKFGRVEKLEFRKMDEGSGGAFVTVTFENTKRDVFVRLSEKSRRIRELTYVPPTNVHQ